ncbi:hypothetical protein JG687_00001010 [Phytophthora cactorum]|uniref:Uncharacterized protein n=1 Tax=Phytophthora cactorum TaxID=29920 RepID=A0A8T1V204_9STRA|nr:hypothetical protein PC123_g1772 [Phytophthora cactorum]KAG6973201.1 hypothetical protein JG687_00001010 [Phytophthora cactorum]
MESPDSTTAHIGGPYPEEILLEAYSLEWESIELRRQRLQKTLQQLLLVEEMEKEELRYKRQLRRLKRQDQEKQARERAEREQEALRREREKEAALSREKERKEEKRAKTVKQVVASGTQTDEEEPVPTRKKETKTKEVKTQMQPKQSQKTKPAPSKRITPISLPSTQPEDDSVSEENQNELGGYDSPLPELPDDGLLSMLSLDQGSDSDDDDDEPSMVSLILPAAQESPKRVQKSPLKKKTHTPKKRFAKRNGGPPLDFNFSNAEARRQAKVAEAAAQAEQEDREEAEAEPEPEPEPMPTPTPKKRLIRRKHQKAAAPGEKNLMSGMANITIAVKPKKDAANSLADKAKTTASDGNTARKKTVGHNAGKGPQPKTKSQTNTAKILAEEEGDSTVAPTKKKVNGKSDTMSIKQRLANAELLTRMSKMQDMSTPKVLGKKTKKGQKQEAAKTLAAQRSEFRKVLSSDTAELDIRRRDQMIEEGDLNISLNSSGLISDKDSPENLRAPTRKRPRGAVEGDVTPTKKLQFLEITKRLAKSPMPRYLRTPTPLMSPVVASGLTKPRAASPGPRTASARTTATTSTRRLNSAPIRPKKTTTNANRFGTSAGGANAAANGGGFSMFDAFVNSGSSGSIPRLKTKTRGGSPSV